MKNKMLSIFFLDILMSITGAGCMEVLGPRPTYIYLSFFIHI